MVKVRVLYFKKDGSHQVDGVIRDNKKQIILQVITFKKNKCSDKDDTFIVDKLDFNDPKLFYHFERQYTSENRYDKFSVQQGLRPSRQYHSVRFLNYMTMSYDYYLDKLY